MSIAPGVWRQSIALNNRLLEQLECQRGELQKAHRAAQIAFDAAKEDLEAVKTHMDDTSSQLRKLRFDNRKLRGRLASRVFLRFPVELLRMIFLELQLSVESADIHSHLVRTPFTLASVCTKWRSLALRTARLWTCIFVPVPEEKLHPCSFERVTALVRRSRNAALDIRLAWDADTELAWAPTDETPESKILALLGTHCSRWRRFDIRLPYGSISRAALDIFRAATPQLEEFLITGPEFTDNGVWGPASPNFFPFCPKLQSFKSECTNVVPSPHNASLKSILRLELYVQMPTAALWSTLQLVASSLQSLDLQLPSELEALSQGLSSRIVFNRLQSLTVYSEAVPLYAPDSGMVSFPNLTSLVASSAALSMLLPLWENTSNKISSISIHHEGDSPPLGRGNAHALRVFTAVNQLTIGSDCAVTSEFLSALSESDADGKWILPALDSLTFGFNATLEAVHGEALVSLLRVRQDAARDGSPGSPRRISDVTFHYADVPDWVESQVRCALTAGGP